MLATYLDFIGRLNAIWKYESSNGNLLIDFIVVVERLDLQTFQFSIIELKISLCENAKTFIRAT